MLCLYKHQKHAKCPQCNRDNGMVTHVLQCQEASTQLTWMAEMDKLQELFTNNKGCMEMTEILISHLKSWHHNIPFPSTNSTSADHRATVHQQHYICRQSLMEGFCSQHWRLHQHKYLLSLKSQWSSIRWTGKLQCQIWHIALGMWEHRNTVLHNQGTTIHKYETDLLNASISTKWHRGGQMLPTEYTHLFNGRLEELLLSSIHNKKKWIITPWTAQDKYQLQSEDRNVHIVIILIDGRCPMRILACIQLFHFIVMIVLH